MTRQKLLRQLKKQKQKSNLLFIRSVKGPPPCGPFASHHEKGAKMAQDMDESLNVLGEALKPCSTSPLTGFFRDGCCNTGPMDHGTHTVCCLLTDEFLAFSKSVGNDLSTPRPEFDFDGLKAGDRWCLCADRWAQADANDAAPHVVLEATHIKTLEKIPFGVLRLKAIDVN